jgi:hypothetical protein
MEYFSSSLVLACYITNVWQVYSFLTGTWHDIANGIKHHTSLVFNCQGIGLNICQLL